jgi:aminoglycoside 3-N-acetyltransferase
VTLLHYAEHIAPFKDKRIARYKVPILRDGARVWVDCEEFNTSSAGVHDNWTENAFELIVEDFLAKRAGTAACRAGQVGLAASVLLGAAELVGHAIPIMTGWAAARAQT